MRDRPWAMAARCLAGIPASMFMIGSNFVDGASLLRACAPGPLLCRNRADSLGKIEHQHFRARALLELDGAGVGLERIAGAELVPIDRDPAARHVDVALAERKRGALRAVEQAGVDARVLVDPHRTVGAVGRDDEPQPAALFRRGEVLLLV